jgi:hypothetical protein
MENNNPCRIYIIENVEHLYNMVDKFDLATASQYYIEKVEHLHMDKSDITNNSATSYPQPPNSHHEPSTGPQLTTSQLVLVFHYTLVSLGIIPRKHIDIAPIARFMHVITDRPYINIDNSDYYKKLKRVPHFKTARSLIKDVEVIKRQLLEVGLKEVALLLELDEELKLACQQINI